MEWLHLRAAATGLGGSRGATYSAPRLASPAASILAQSRVHAALQLFNATFSKAKTTYQTGRTNHTRTQSGRTGRTHSLALPKAKLMETHTHKKQNDGDTTVPQHRCHFALGADEWWRSGGRERVDGDGFCFFRYVTLDGLSV